MDFHIAFFQTLLLLAISPFPDLFRSYLKPQPLISPVFYYQPSIKLLPLPMAPL